MTLPQFLVIFLALVAGIFVLQLIQTWRIIRMSQKTDAVLALIAKIGQEVGQLVSQAQAGQAAAVDAFADQVTAAATPIDSTLVTAITPQAGS